MKALVAAALALALLAAIDARPAYAACIFNGEEVDEGTQIGDSVCRDGKWVDAEG